MRRFRAGQNRAVCRCCDVDRRTSLTNCFSAPSAHIGIPLSGVVAAAHLSFFRASLDSKISALRFAVTPPPAVAAARLDTASLPLPEKKPLVAAKLESAPLAEAKRAERRAPARADRPFRGIALILLSTTFLGVSDVTAKYLS